MNRGDTVFAGSIPDLYDRYLVPMLFEPYAAALAERVRSSGARRVLETAAGTGVVTRAMLGGLPPDASITATDLNVPMVAHAARHHSDPRLCWAAADAQALPFGPGALDLVVCQFGVMFFPDQPRAFSEARRVLRPGGTFLLAVWDGLPHNDFARVVHEAVAAEFPHDPPQFIARTPHGHGDAGALERRLRAAGFASVEVEQLDARSRAASARVPALALCQGTPLRGEIVARAPGRLDAVTDAAARALAAAFGDEAIEGALRAHVLTAR